MAAITRRVTDSSAIAASRIAAVASMKREVEHFTNIKKLLEKAQDQFCELICDDDEVGVAYQTLEEAQDLVLNGKETKESHIDEEEDVLLQFFAADDVSRTIKVEIYACVSRLRADRRKCEDECQHIDSHGYSGNQNDEDSGCNFSNKNENKDN
ncbi:hypothetical protein ACJ73_08683 [Blastomyces percursus]|uniref:Tubulin-specific chaperone A n=1 Tax=Blastomyces percursus TaxID=1658174 RepID=A0A1J9QFE5_9EURO|nr:hypothetical protein ACJ73_08683 [Blastomyces percursus]